MRRNYSGDWRKFPSVSGFCNPFGLDLSEGYDVSFLITLFEMVN